MLEPPVSWLKDTIGMSRGKAALTAGSVAFVLALLGALSFSALTDVHPLGNVGVFANKTFFELFVYIVTQVVMPAGGVLVTLFAGWVIKRQFSADELFGGKEPLVYKAWLFIVRFIAPILLAIVLFSEMTKG